MKGINKSEVIFKVFAYFVITLFAIMALYPLVYAFSSSISGKVAYETGRIVLFPIDIQFDTYLELYNDNGFWVSYSNTIFYTVIGTIWSMFVSIVGAYALSKRRLLFKRQFNFMIVFTMWFSAGVVPTYLNYQNLFSLFGLSAKWGIVFAFGAVTYNIILLRSGFENVPKEIEEAAIIDGASEVDILLKVYMPIAKPTIAAVTLFYAVAKWNGYFWNMMLVEDIVDSPLQVYMRILIDNYEQAVDSMANAPFAPQSYVYAILITSIIPILIIYPYVQKYFETGVTLGGVKE